jgi:hypothetical protein
MTPDLISFSDTQLAIVQDAAAKLPCELRSPFLEIVAAQVRVRTIDIQDAVERALTAVVAGSRSEVAPEYWMGPSLP